MTEQIKKTYRNCRLIGALFSPCITDGTWFVARWEVIETNTNKQVLYLFGINGVEATLYEKEGHDLTLSELVMDTMINHIEDNGFKPEMFRFEFNGNEFELCKEKPKWADYDCGVIEEK